MFRVLFVAFFTVISSVSLAEYRAFDLLITNTQTGKARTVRSTLDHVQYPQYFYLSSAETIEYQDSWMCYERSDYFKPICANPKDSQAPPRQPAATNP